MEGKGTTRVHAFYAVYFMGLICLYAVLGYALGLKIALVLFVAIQVSCLLLLVVLCWNKPLPRAPTAMESEQQPRESAL
jgi:heme A synthase